MSNVDNKHDFSPPGGGMKWRNSITVLPMPNVAAQPQSWEGNFHFVGWATKGPNLSRASSHELSPAGAHAIAWNK